MSVGTVMAGARAGGQAALNAGLAPPQGGGGRFFSPQGGLDAFQSGLGIVDGAMQIVQGLLQRRAAEQISDDAKQRAAFLERRARQEALLRVENERRLRSTGINRAAASGIRLGSGNINLLFQQSADTTAREANEIVFAADVQAAQMRRAARRAEKGSKLAATGQIIGGSLDLASSAGTLLFGGGGA